MLYFIVGFIFSVLSFIEIIAKDKKIFRAIFFILIIFLIFLAGFRDGALVGTDSPAYYRYYIDKLPPVEIGYKYLNFTVASLGLSYTVFLLVVNTISLFNIGNFIRLNSKYLIFPLFIYFSDFYFYYNFSGIRQAVAMSFVALSVYFVYQGKKTIASLFILVASFFHVTALVFLISLFVPKVKVRVENYIKFLIILVFCILLGSYIIENIPYLSYRFKYYSSMQEQSGNIVGDYYIGVLKRSIVLITVIMVYKNFFDDNKNFFLYNLYLIGFIIYVVSYLISPEFGVRLGSYFIILDCILISRYIFMSKSYVNKVFYFLLFTLIAFYKIYTYTLLQSFDYKFLGL